MSISDSFKLWCEVQALHCRELLGLKPFEKLSAFDLAACMQIMTIEPGFVPGLSRRDRQVLLKQFDENWSAVTVICDDVSVIIYNSRHQIPRLQADVMHELAHIICKHKPMILQRVDDTKLFVREFNDRDEQQAAYLGGCLQIPLVGLKHLFDRGQQDVTRIARFFNASIAMTKHRINVTRIQA